MVFAWNFQPIASSPIDFASSHLNQPFVRRSLQKCRHHNAGITGSSFSVVSRDYETEDPFDEVDAQEELHDLVDEIPLLVGSCPVEEYINGENDIPICMQY